MKQTKQVLVESTIDLIARGGVEAATVRAIAQASEVTEGTIYRHFPSKQELYRYAYRRIVNDMVVEKEKLLKSERSTPEKIREWIRLTFEYYDKYPEAFAYVFLVPVPKAISNDKSTRRQGDMFLKFIKEAQTANEIRNMLPELALSHFTGLMLNIPRLINADRLPGPALKYLDEVDNAVWRILRA